MASRRSPLLPIFLTVFVDVLGLTLVLPLLPFYAEHFGASPLVVGALTASYAACQLFSGPVLGRLSDRFGRKPTLIASQLGTFAGFLVLGSANTLWMLFLGRIIDGLTAGNLTIAQAYISDVTKPEERTRAFGFIGVAFGMGFLMGPAISGLLARRFGYGAPAFGAAALSALSVVVTATMLRSSTPPDAAGPGADTSPVFRARAFEVGRYLRRPAVRHRLITFFVYTLGFSTMFGGLALFLERRFSLDVENVGYVFGLSGLVGTLVQGGLVGRLAARMGEERLSQLGFVCLIVGNGLAGFAPTLPLFLVLVAIGAFGMAVTRPCLTTLITKSVGRDEQGGALGTSQSFASIAQIVGPLVAGWLIERRLLAVYGLAAASFSVIGVGLSLRKPSRAVS